MTLDKNLLKNRFAANFRSYNALAVVQDNICEKLAELVSDNVPVPQIRRGLEIGSGTGFLTRHLLEKYPAAKWFVNDIAEESARFVNRYVQNRDVEYVWGDAESTVFPRGLDLIASASTVQWFDRTPEFIAKARESLTGNGWLALTTFGRDNFHEIKAVTGEGLDYYSLNELENMVCAAGFETVYGNEYTRQLLFGTPADVLRHIKATGVNSLKKVRWNKQRLADFEADYRQLFSSSPTGRQDGGGVTLTYHPIIILARLCR